MGIKRSSHLEFHIALLAAEDKFSKEKFHLQKQFILVQKTKLLGSDKIPVLILNTEHGLKTFFIAKLNIIDWNLETDD